MQYIVLVNPVEDIVNDLLDSAEQGYTWGNSVVIALTAALLAISLIKFLYDRS